MHRQHRLQWIQAHFDPDDFFDDEWRQRAFVVKRNTRRIVYKLTSRTNPARSVYVKHDRVNSLPNLLKNLWRRKAQREYRAGMVLAAAGVPVVRMLGWGKTCRDSYLVTEDFETGEDFAEVWKRVQNDRKQRQEFLQALHRFLHMLFSTDVWHPDLHAGNVLVEQHRQCFEFVLVDLYGVFIRHHTGLAKRVKMLCWLNLLRTELTSGERAALFNNLFNDSAEITSRKVEQLLTEECRKAVASSWPGRRTRLLKQSSLCDRCRTDNGMWLLKKPFQIDMAEAVLQNYDSQKSAGAEIIKRDRKRLVARVQVEGKTFIVKEFLLPGPWGRLAPDCRSWLNTHRLNMYAIPTVACYAWLKRKTGQGVLIMEDAGEQQLYHTLRQCGNSAYRQELLKAAGKLLAQMHNMSLLHADTKASNLMIDANSPYPEMPLKFVDLDDVRFQSRLTGERCSRNLEQLAETLQPVVNRFEIALILTAYANERDLTRRQLRRICPKLSSYCQT